MAASVLPSPGTKYGPCKIKCEHKDCQSLRTLAAQVCSFCNKPIGFNTRFYNDDQFGYVHALCFEDHFEETRP